MPWKETDPVDQRTQFIAAVLTEEYSFAELCRRFGVSRTTGYKWLERYRNGGYWELGDRSRSPHNQASATSEATVELIVATRQAHPTWGPRKLKAYLQRKYPNAPTPAASTIGAILKRRGLVAGRRTRKRGRPATSPLPDPNKVNKSWSVDFKGQFKLGTGEYCYPLTMMDAHSRYLLRCQALPSTSTDGVWPVMEAAFFEFGLPEAIRSDNGTPFAAGTFTGLTRLSAWWVAHGIRLERIEPGNPQQNGRLERFHKTLKAETAKPPKANFDLQQIRFSAFQTEYNEERPHEALDDEVPDRHYTESDRKYTRRLPEPEYSDDAVLRIVDVSGETSFRGFRVYLTDCIARHRVAYVPLDDGLWSIRFYHHELAKLDERKGTITNGRVTKMLKRPKSKKRTYFMPLDPSNCQPCDRSDV